MWKATKNDSLQFAGLYDETIEGVACNDESSSGGGLTLKIQKVMTLRRNGMRIITLEDVHVLPVPMLKEVCVAMLLWPRRSRKNIL